MEVNLEAAGNVQLKAREAFDQADVGYWHLKNSSDFIRNAHTLLRWCNQYRLVPKSNGGYQLVVDMWGVNQFMKQIHQL
jgi:hypothetical protein